MPDPKPKRRLRLPRKLVLTATAGLASVTLHGCLFTSGNLVAPPPCDDAGNWDCTDAGPDAGPSQPIDAGQDAGAVDAGDATDAGDAADAGDATDAGDTDASVADDAGA